jgi:hypothetical protein
MKNNLHHMFLIKENEYADTFTDNFLKWNYQNYVFHFLKEHFSNGISFVGFGEAFHPEMQKSLQDFQKERKIKDFMIFSYNEVDYEVRFVHNGRQISPPFVVYDHKKSLYK